MTPGRGAIACGYFVTTILAHAGFKVSRARLARRPSEAIIRSLVQSRWIKRYSNTPLNRFVSSVRAQGDGIFIVGLDFHTGFLVVRSKRVRFVHANYLAPRRVIDEPALRSPALRKSKYRVTGKLTDDPQLLTAWLIGRKIKTR